MTAVEQTAGTMPPREASGHEFYGRAVWPWGEDGDLGVMIEGHGRRAVAALSAYGRDIDGRGWLPHMLFDLTERWVTVHLDCGCTTEQHAEHHQDGDWYCPCRRPGLPPCDSRTYRWTVEYVAEGDPGAIALTEVRW